MIIQQTFGWNPDTGKVEPQRTKEEAEDYRYFPDPDLVPVVVDEAWRKRLLSELPELPADKRRRWAKEYQLPDYDVRVLTEEREIAEYFQSVLEHFNQPKTVSNWMMTELLRLLKESPDGGIRITPKDFAQVLQKVEEGAINRNSGKEVIEEAFKTGKSPQSIIEQKGLAQISDESSLIALADQVIAEQTKAASNFRSGNEKVLGFLVGQLMAKTKGRANPQVAAKVLRERLNP
ncbi:MAG: hypothetical protein A2Z21_09145 [Candidatus Fraserbacteria bacterium RBG_16_55_9]|uniref:Asn/Gln amidotransferase domain-containing protein n=1 Tax=Fraserbacteria sp. (strain RBG_16_55_9) TaxID=1817864 RepID=A0A1F5UVU3_FRAXR|nr:MAG: hypothetical protein A2Z21_09145 [Candidatus Fraserbacteria bacterium RBG_16_55_9]